jgi:hypothetical protein
LQLFEWGVLLSHTSASVPQMLPAQPITTFRYRNCRNGAMGGPDTRILSRINAKFMP